MGPIIPILKAILAGILKGSGGDSPPAGGNPDTGDFDYASPSTRRAFARSLKSFRPRPTSPQPEEKQDPAEDPSALSLFGIISGVAEAFSLVSKDLRSRFGGRVRSRGDREARSSAKDDEPHRNSSQTIRRRFNWRKFRNLSWMKPRSWSRAGQKRKILADIAKQDVSRKQEEQQGFENPPRSPRPGGFLSRIFSGGWQKYRARSLAGGMAGIAQPGNKLNPNGDSADYGKLIAMMGQPQAQVNQAKQEMRNSGPEGQQSGLLRRSIGLIGGVVGRLASIGVAAFVAYKSLQLFGNITLESRRKLADFNGQISAAFTRLRVQEIQQNIQMGRATQGSTVGLAESMRDLRESSQESRQAFTSVMNYVASGATQAASFMAGLYKQIDILIPLARLIEGNTRKDQKVDLPLMQLLESLRTGDNQNVPPLGRLP